jgi:hypothetical protein
VPQADIGTASNGRKLLAGFLMILVRTALFLPIQIRA